MLTLNLTASLPCGPDTSSAVPAKLGLGSSCNCPVPWEDAQHQRGTLTMEVTTPWRSQSPLLPPLQARPLILHTVGDKLHHFVPPHVFGAEEVT